MGLLRFYPRNKLIFSDYFKQITNLDEISPNNTLFKVKIYDNNTITTIVATITHINDSKVINKVIKQKTKTEIIFFERKNRLRNGQRAKVSREEATEACGLYQLEA